MMGTLARIARHRLIGRCERHWAHLRSRDDGYDGSTDQIREGILAAKRVILEVPAAGSLGGYLGTVDAALLRELSRLSPPGAGEDDRTSAGVATLRAEVGRIREWLFVLCLKTLLVVGAVAAAAGWLLRHDRA